MLCVFCGIPIQFTMGNWGSEALRSMHKVTQLSVTAGKALGPKCVYVHGRQQLLRATLHLKSGATCRHAFFFLKLLKHLIFSTMQAYTCYINRLRKVLFTFAC